ncbi:DNA polymerase III subunit gamma and tau [Hoyosella rhizosphaerae]|uniref:DNA polymerase III subunit gamma/tau n=1 Tax=Hoyosella rhizosphaerae TaxID=1755582 RepID=A0A916XJ96_9ACTN|nr:DNA polymerase III subunit gamma and tau [Hoyosella rhizosphaerae]MBN4925408.1 DNA polymerase III subunit gamma and tau [Hoyosella rhizosphaerae]GGC75420.1 DNA polymerase III, subunit gamma/tau [Hoyosella rhizosphaerae]
MALYRKYRPASFAEVVGQEHVTEPLSVALNAGRVNHAYLFSGPRGCGKTSSARILARSLNCVEGPTSAPCGVCPSCIALGPGGPGNLDVIELDAASHGGVDDTRELRDRAFYSPAESRYRVFIVDEAHMVTNAGFNALLKIVEEPPEHLIFIFATTEPEKVLPTIKSRTHHYPFRLLPPPVMRGLVERICAQENVHVDDAVFPLVIRSGGGSPRDTLSVMDQLLAGAGEDGVTYERALALLGVTDVALIDGAVDALADDDAAALFGTVNRVMDAGFDPRRFTADLLQRIRDLILVQAVPDATTNGLVDEPAEAIARMLRDVERFGPATLARYAELLHDGLAEMRGATAPRLLLEVLCARMLLPSVSQAESAVLQRLERLERGIPTRAPQGAGEPQAQPPSQVQPPSDLAKPVFARPSHRSSGPETPVKPPTPDTPAPAPEIAKEPELAPKPSVPTAVDQPPVDNLPAEPAVRDSAVDATPSAPEPADDTSSTASGLDVRAVEAAWSQICAQARQRSKIVEVMLSGAKIVRVQGTNIVLDHDTAALAGRLREGRNATIVTESFTAALGVECTIAWSGHEQNAAAATPPAQPRAQQNTPNQNTPNQNTPSRGVPPSKSTPSRPTFVRKSSARDPQQDSSPQRVNRPQPTNTPPHDDVPPPDDPGYPDDPAEFSGVEPQGHPNATPVVNADNEDELIAEARREESLGNAGNSAAQRRDPEEMAIELLATELGAKRID